MNIGRVHDENNLFRLCVFPLSFDKRAFAPMRMWHLVRQNGALHASLAWERFVPTSEFVHGYGCRLAFGINERKRNAGKFLEKDRHYYCGAYRLKAEAIRALPTTPGLFGVASAEIRHQIEAGEIAHADLRIVLSPGDFDIEGTKTAIVDRLWNSCCGPLRHTCDCDAQINPHASANLIEAPQGDCSGFRSRLVRLGYMIRFNLFNWVWTNSIQPAVGHPETRSRMMRFRSAVRFQVCNWLWQQISDPVPPVVN